MEISLFHGWGEWHFWRRFAWKVLAAQTGQLGGNLRQNIHLANLRRDPEILARAVFHTQYPRMAAHPALLARGQFGRQDENQFHVRAFHHGSFGIQENSVRADISSLGAQLGISVRGSDADGQPSDDSLARTSISLKVRFLKAHLSTGKNCRSGVCQYRPTLHGWVKAAQIRWWCR